jgi:TRAP transporter TAXI family solute receptor
MRATTCAALLALALSAIPPASPVMAQSAAPLPAPQQPATGQPAPASPGAPDTGHFRAPHGELINLATAGTGGLYYALGREICRAVNRDHQATGMRCLAEATAGSRANLTALARRQTALALAQHSDVLEANRTGATRLRVLARLYTEMFVFVLAPGVDRRALAEPLALRVNPGPAGSGHRAAFSAVLGALGQRPDALDRLAGRDSLGALDQLCTGALDLVPLMIGQPHALIARALGDCGAELAVPARETVARVVGAGGGLVAAHLPENSYGPGTPALDTFGTSVLLVASPRVTEALAHDVMQRLLIDLPQLSARHAVMRGVQAADLYPPSGVPAHPGTIKALREVAPPAGR